MIRDATRVVVIGPLLLLLLLTGGCTSISSTRVGYPEHGKKVSGMPIVVQRDRWLKITHQLVTYSVDTTLTKGAAPRAAAETDNALEAAAGQSPELRVLTVVSKHVQVTPEILEVGELYAVDLKRPFFGKITAAHMTFAKKAKDPRTYQYPVTLGATVDDQTLAKITELIPQVATGLLGLAPAASIGDEIVGKNLIREVTDLRVEIYDVRRPNDGPILVLPIGGWAEADSEQQASARLSTPSPRAPPSVVSTKKAGRK